MVSSRNFRRPLFPKPVYWLGLFLLFLTARRLYVYNFCACNCLISAFKPKNRDGTDKNEYLFKCAKCNISFPNIVDLEKHITCVHEEKKQRPVSELGNPISVPVSPRYFVSSLLRNNIILQFFLV